MLPYIAYMDPMGMAIIGDIPYCMFSDKGKKLPDIWGIFPTSEARALAVSLGIRNSTWAWKIGKLGARFMGDFSQGK